MKLKNKTNEKLLADAGIVNEGAQMCQIPTEWSLATVLAKKLFSINYSAIQSL